MKLSIGLLALVFAAAMPAQDFEGTIIWKMQAEIADPAMRSELQSAQAQRGSPETRARMKAAQAALQSPEVQAMMAQNPQMKAMLEQQMGALKGPAAGEGEGALGGMFPRGLTLKAKGARSLVTIDGGMFPREILTQSDTGATYQIDRAGKSYRRLPPDRAPAGAAPAHKITRTGERAKILGYNCVRYLVEDTAEPEQGTYTIWVTKDIKGLDPKRLKNLRVGRDQGSNFMDQLDGVPMKMEISMPQARLVMEVSAIRPESLPAALFELPAGFTDSTR